VKEECALSGVYEDFRDHVAKVTAHGDTRLYDALEHATTMLLTARARYPNCRLRILALSDGVDSGSQASAVNVAKALQVLFSPTILHCFTEGASLRWCRPAG
jgi:Mg-chelatase subunit ChlD